MREEGFEPSQALSYESLNLARLTTPAFPHEKTKNLSYKNLYKLIICSKFEDSHSRLETPVLIPNTEVKPPTLLAVVSRKTQTLQAVFV